MNEIKQIADYLEIPISYFFSNFDDDEEIHKIISTIQDQPKEAKFISFALVKLFLEIQSPSKKILSNPDKEFEPEELGEIVLIFYLFNHNTKL